MSVTTFNHGQEETPEEKICEICNDEPGRVPHHHEVEGDAWMLKKNGLDWEDLFLKLHYEPEHEEGGVCWCKVVYEKRGNELHILHHEQRDEIKSFIKDNFISREKVREVVEGLDAYHPVDRGYASKVADEAKNPTIGDTYLKRKDVLQAIKELN